METDSAKLHTAKQTIEQQKLNIREELLRSEQDKLELNNEKHGLFHNLIRTTTDNKIFEKNTLIVY